MSNMGDNFHTLWSQTVERLTAPEERDPIELAAQDMRTVRAAQYLILETETGYDEDEEELLAQVGHEYMIGPDEVRAALELAEDRIANG